MVITALSSDTGHDSAAKANTLPNTTHCPLRGLGASLLDAEPLPKAPVQSPPSKLCAETTNALNEKMARLTFTMRCFWWHCQGWTAFHHYKQSLE